MPRHSSCMKSWNSATSTHKLCRRQAFDPLRANFESSLLDALGRVGSAGSVNGCR